MKHSKTTQAIVYTIAVIITSGCLFAFGVTIHAILQVQKADLILITGIAFYFFIQLIISISNYVKRRNQSTEDSERLQASNEGTDGLQEKSF